MPIYVLFHELAGLLYETGDRKCFRHAEEGGGGVGISNSSEIFCLKGVGGKCFHSLNKRGGGRKKFYFVLRRRRKMFRTRPRPSKGETRPHFSKVGNRVFTTMALLPRVCLSAGPSSECETYYVKP